MYVYVCVNIYIYIHNVCVCKKKLVDILKYLYSNITGQGVKRSHHLPNPRLVLLRIRTCPFALVVNNATPSTVRLEVIRLRSKEIALC